MLRPSFQRKMPPSADAERGGFVPAQREQHAAEQVDHQIAAHARAVFLPAAPAREAVLRRRESSARRSARYPSRGSAGERSNGGGYSQAPVGSLRPRLSSTISTSPMAPL